MAGGREFDRSRFKELVLLLVDRSEGDPRKSRVKLNKLLYYSDFEAFRLLGRSITGARYVKGEHGPMAAELPIAEEELGRSGYLEWRLEPAGPYEQKVPVAKEPADTARFSEAELKIIDAALAELALHGGKGAREWSHEQSAGWNVAREYGDDIDYGSTFISTAPIPEADLARARQFVREEGWVRKAS